MIFEKLIKIRLNILFNHRHCRYVHKNNFTSNNEEINKFDHFCKTWWSSDGQMKALHSYNKLRIPLIRDGILNVNKNKNCADISKPNVLQDFKILDIGCGGGILSEPLARLGANVTGLDPNDNLIQLAKEHSSLDQSIANCITYVSDTIENFSPEHKFEFDAVILSEVIEHIENKEEFLSNCINTLKNNGSLFITTLNKTSLSWFFGILMAEKMCGIVPNGTHDWEKFISPDRLRYILEKSKETLYNYSEIDGCNTILVHGTLYNPLTNEWSWNRNTQITYALHAIKQNIEK